MRRFPEAVKMTQKYTDGDFGRGVSNGLKERVKVLKVLIQIFSTSVMVATNMSLLRAVVLLV